MKTVKNAHLKSVKFIRERVHATVASATAKMNAGSLAMDT